MAKQGAMFHFIKRLQERYGIRMSSEGWKTISEEVGQGRHHYLISDRGGTEWYYLKVGAQWVYAAYRLGAGLITVLTKSQFCNSYGFPCKKTYLLPTQCRPRSLQMLLEYKVVPDGWDICYGSAYRKKFRGARRRT